MLSELLNEIEVKLRQIIREEVRAALLESKNPNFNLEEIIKIESETSNKPKEYIQILTAQEVAQILGVNVQRVYELTRQRESNGLPVIVLGERQYRYSREAILKWMERDYK